MTDAASHQPPSAPRSMPPIWMRSEWWPTAIASLAAFALLASNSVLRPVRDSLGLRGGPDQLPWLFTGTFLVMLVASPIFALASARLRRRTLLVVAYAFFALVLVGFRGLLALPSLEAFGSYAFFIWASVFNLFIVSIFWSFLADVFSTEQAKRRYGYVAAGATLGAIAGPAFVGATVKSLGSFNMLLVAAGLLAVPIAGSLLLGRWLQRANPEQAAKAPDRPLGGGFLAGVRLAVSSPLLAGLCVYFILFTMLATFVYLEQARIVSEAFPDKDARTAFNAGLDLKVNVATLALQLGVTRLLLRWIGSFRSLFVLPLVTLGGVVALTLSPSVLSVTVVQVIRRAADYAFARPARETLFTLVSREERYKAKNFIETAVYRGGDTLAGWVEAAMKAAGGTALAVVAIPLSIGWIGLVGWLGWRCGRMERRDERVSG